MQAPEHGSTGHDRYSHDQTPRAVSLASRLTVCLLGSTLCVCSSVQVFKRKAGMWRCTCGGGGDGEATWVRGDGDRVAVTWRRRMDEALRGLPLRRRVAVGCRRWVGRRMVGAVQQVLTVLVPVVGTWHARWTWTRAVGRD